MKTHSNKILFIAFVLITSSVPVWAQNETKEQLTIPLTDPGKPGSLEVGLVTGSIKITGYTGNQVVVDASTRSSEKNKKEKQDENAGGMKKLTPVSKGIDLTGTEEKNHVTLSSKRFDSALDLAIKVPQMFSLKVSTVNNGDIVIENVNGELEITNVNGLITMTNVSGSAVANTINGNLKANFKTVNPESPMAFSTLNGNIDVTFPASAKFDVKLKSDRGEIYSDFDVDVDNTQPKAVRTSKEGMYKVSVEDWVKGKINGGGKEIMMKNMNGNIYVRKSK
jgi:nucleoside diphosphate kinase